MFQAQKAVSQPAKVERKENYLVQLKERRAKPRQLHSSMVVKPSSAKPIFRKIAQTVPRAYSGGIG